MLFAFLLACVLAPSGGGLYADPYPPYWGGVANAVHHSPAGWPATWTAYTIEGAEIKDRRDSDPSNGGRAPTHYINLTSGCTEQSSPSVYYAYDSTEQVLFFRYRVEDIPNNYATVVPAGAYQPSDPYEEALWNVLMDTDGDGFYNLAASMDGTRGAVSNETDLLWALYTETPTQSFDFNGNPDIYNIGHNPTAFVDNATSLILNFQQSVLPAASWPSGTAETVWDYGTTRAVKILGFTCDEYFLDYQVPLAMLNTTAYGGAAFDECAPFSLAFGTSTDPDNPVGGDIAFDGTLLGDTTTCLPFGDVIQLCGSKSVQEPVVLDVTASGTGCPAALEAHVIDAIASTCEPTVSEMKFYYYYDRNANSLPDDLGSAWTLAGGGANSIGDRSKWTLDWDSSALYVGQYLVGVRALDRQGNCTYSHLDSASLPGSGDCTAEAANLTPSPGKLLAKFSNMCGTGASIVKTSTPAFVNSVPGSVFEFTLEVFNTTGGTITLTELTDRLPTGYVYNATTGGGLTNAIVNSPAIGDTENIAWVFNSIATVPAGMSNKLVFEAVAPLRKGTVSNFANTVTSLDPSYVLQSNPLDIGVGVPYLSIAKTASTKTADPGDTITYTITYSNDSPINITGANITDIVPNGFSNVVPGQGGTYNATTREITWPVGNMITGSGPYTLTFSATVNSPFPGNAAILSINNAVADSNESEQAQNQAIVLINVPRPRLDIRKNSDKLVIDPAVSNAVTYTLTYENTGNATAANVVVWDEIPRGFVYNSATPAPTTSPGVGQNGTVTWDLGPMDSNVTNTITLVLNTVDPYTGGNPSINTAYINATGLANVSDASMTSVYSSAYTCAANPSKKFYFHSETTTIGVSNSVLTAKYDDPDGAAASTATQLGVGPTEVVIAQFYQDPVAQLPFDFNGDMTLEFYVSKDGGLPGIFTAYVHDYNPDTDTYAYIGSNTLKVTGRQAAPVLQTISVTPAVSGMAPLHRLRWTITMYTDHQFQTNDVTLYYDSATYPTNSTVCLRSIIFNKEADVLSALPGETVVYSLQFANAGFGDLSGAQISDILPPYVTLTNATLNGVEIASPDSYCTGTLCTFTVQGAGDAAGTITAGNSGVLTLTVTLEP